MSNHTWAGVRACMNVEAGTDVNTCVREYTGLEFLYCNSEFIKSDAYKESSVIPISAMDNMITNMFIQTIPCTIGHDTVTLDGDTFEKLLNIKIKLPSNIRYSSVERQYYRVCGKKVTEIQACNILKIIDIDSLTSRQLLVEDRFKAVETDNGYIVRGDINNINPLHFTCDILSGKSLPRNYGWIQMNGTINSAGATMRNASLFVIIIEWLCYLFSFPYLELAVCLTNRCALKLSDSDFVNSIVAGLKIGNGLIEVLSKQQCMNEYTLYKSMYT